MGAVRTAILSADQGFDYAVRAGQLTQANASPRGKSLGAAMNDLLVVGMTIVIFALFFILVKVVENIER
jgi:hypothetical protein